jgi:hypothetical protein
VRNDGAMDVCKEPPYSESCLTSVDWLENVSVISNDLFMGRQFSRPKYIPEKQPEPVFSADPQTVAEVKWDN